MKTKFRLVAILVFGLLSAGAFAECQTSCSDVCDAYLYGNCTHWGKNCTTVCDGGAQTTCQEVCLEQLYGNCTKWGQQCN